MLIPTNPTSNGVRWRGRVWRIAGGAIDLPTDAASQRIEQNLAEHHAPELRALEQATALAAQQRAALLRPDGTPRYAAVELAEREAAINASLEAAMTRVTAVADAAIEAARRTLVMIDGADPLDRLTPAEQERAATRQGFLAVDVAELPPEELAKRIRAALASNDKPALFLYARHLPHRLEATPPVSRQELLQLTHELTERLADPQAKAKREKAERWLSAAQVLQGRVSFARRGGDEGLRQRLLASGRYGR